MILEKFEEGKRYIFTKEQYLVWHEDFKNHLVNNGMPIESAMITKSSIDNNKWVYQIDTLEVKVETESTGLCDKCTVCPNWCIEI